MVLLKPFLMLASVAFVVGFMGYLGAVKLATPVETAQAPQQSWSSAASAPAVADDWNAGKRI
jgi:hypothetical protein